MTETDGIKSAMNLPEERQENMGALRKEAEDFLRQAKKELPGQEAFEQLALRLAECFRIPRADPEKEEEAYLFAQSFFREKSFREYRWQNTTSNLAYSWFATIRDVPYLTFREKMDEGFVVSLTSYPARIRFAAGALETVFRQTLAPRETVLWLAKEQFPGREKDLPEELTAFLAEGKLRIRWCDDLKPHKKYYYMMQEERDRAIVNIDDDLLFPEDAMELLMLSHIRHPEAVSAMRVHCMAVDGNGNILPYRYWIKETDAQINKPGMLLFPTTGFGTLYGPGLLSDRLFDQDTIRATCLMADDLWMKTVEILENIPVTLACMNRGWKYVAGSQEESLWNSNQFENDRQMTDIIARIDAEKGAGYFAGKLRTGMEAREETGVEPYGVHAARQIETLQGKLKKTYAEKSEMNRQLKETRKIRAELTEARAKNEALEARVRKFEKYTLYNLVKPILNRQRNRKS